MKKIRENCPLCNTNARNSLYLNENLVVCNKCSLIYNSKLSNLDKKEWESFNFDKSTQNYDRARTRYFDYLWSYILKLTEKDKGRVLDIGCGSGLLLRAANDNGWDAQGIEISENICAQASKNSKCKVFNCLIEEANFPSKSFDLIVMSDLFRYLINPGKVLKICRRLLKNKGMLVIKDINYKSLFLRKRNLVNKYIFQFLSKETAEKFMAKSGFKSAEFYPSPISFLTLKPINRSENLSYFLSTLFNNLIRFLYCAGEDKLINLTPQMLIIAKNEVS